MTCSDWFILFQTIILGLTAWYVKKYTNETKKANELTARISEADFILKLDRTIFTERFRYITALIETEKLTFEINTDYRFREDRYIHTGANMGYHPKITVFEMDDVVLGNFENIGILLKKEYIPVELIYGFFGYFIKVCWENEEIQKFIIAEKTRVPKYSYSNFEFLYYKCKSYEDTTK